MRYLKDRGFVHRLSAQITPRAVYRQRRQALQWAGACAGAVALGAPTSAPAAAAAPDRLAALPGVRGTTPGATTTERATPHAHVVGYNNYYEFGLDKGDPARHAHRLRTRPWTVAVEGEVARPRVWDIDELLRLAPMEERIYRLRCVEGWSMVIPWVGWSLAELIRRAEPNGSARYVEFVTLADPAQMPGLRSSVLR